MRKGRIWACVGYPESLPTDWLERLQETGLQIAISPLHDKDLDPTGESKKPHYHIIFNYEGPTTLKHVKDLCDSLNMTIPIKLESLRGMYRYHIHIDNPDKYQYDDRDRTLLNGFDPASVDALTKTEVDKYIQEILEFIEDNNILEYRDLIFTLKGYPNMRLVACSHTMLFNTYIKSKRHKFQKLIEKEEKRKDMKD
uniref:Replication protein n=1 Tax=Dulem virus 59 TaxID=3145770 RepID=A0AAU8B6U1_9VIRU